MKQTIDYDEIETIHVYMVREDDQPELENNKPPSWPRFHWPNIAPTWAKVQQIIMASIAVLMLAGFAIAPMGEPLFTIKTLRIPLIALPLQIFMTSVNITPTGIQQIPAASARGALTVYNGSTLQESLPVKFIVTSASGVEIETDQAVTIPAADPPSFGVASVPAHAVQPGAAGNIEAYSVDQADGSTITIKNTSAFTGGADASTKIYATAADVNNATTAARQKVEGRSVKGLMIQPCSEKITPSAGSVRVERTCQTYTYTLPKHLRIISLKIKSDIVFVEYKSFIA